MGIAVQVMPVTADNPGMLGAFMASLNEEKQTFRYFETRGIAILKNHLFTCLLIHNDSPVAYGHLDEEDGIVWLGIVVRKEFQGKGLAKKLMLVLIQKAEEAGLIHIQLSVDIGNDKAVNLYRQFGFREVSRGRENFILKKDL